MIHELHQLFGVTDLSEFGVSHLSDNVVVLITADGIVLVDSIVSYG